ncbi:MAG: caspase family protein [Rhodocyclaceae bacterium]|nr:caspase family protein [Rhodocyclaceae bacterium]
MVHRSIFLDFLAWHCAARRRPSNSAAMAAGIQPGAAETSHNCGVRPAICFFAGSAAGTPNCPSRCGIRRAFMHPDFSISRNNIAAGPKQLARKSRRAFLRCAASLPLMAMAGGALRAQERKGKLYALVFSNSSYRPETESFVNGDTVLHQVTEVLEQRGFQTTGGFDLDVKASRAEIDRFVQRLNNEPDALGMFYFFGHGTQVDGKNYLLPGNSETMRVAEDQWISLDRDVFPRFATQTGAGRILVLDCCRSSATPGRGGAGTMNQATAPPGCLVTYSAAPGRSALNLRIKERLSYFSDAFVTEFRKFELDRPISEFFTTLQVRVPQSMLREDWFARCVADKKCRPQEPEVVPAPDWPSALNFQGSRERRKDGGAASGLDADWEGLRSNFIPEQVIASIEQFLKRNPDSKFDELARRQLERAKQTADALDEAGLDITPSRPLRDIDKLGELVAKALRDGDSYASLAIADIYQQGGQGIAANADMELAWLRVAAAQKNGIAAYRAFENFSARKRDLEAARYRGLYQEAGYTPPPTLKSKGR